MTTPLFDAHGITINDPADGYHTDSEINDFVQSVRSIPTPERTDYFNAVRRHWDHQHFVVAPDDVYLQLRGDGSFRQQSVVFNYGGLTGHDGLEVPDSA